MLWAQFYLWLVTTSAFTGNVKAATVVHKTKEHLGSTWDFCNPDVCKSDYGICDKPKQENKPEQDKCGIFNWGSKCSGGKCCGSLGYEWRLGFFSLSDRKSKLTFTELVA